ncbi:MAG: hypothetical protein OXG41_10435 [Acidimicrobiaceae bacterium]|nr:hypothetical protein [Acidimicrobiaceae bacterium]
MSDQSLSDQSDTVDERDDQPTERLSFPYRNLADVITLITRMHSAVGPECSIGDLAGAVEMSVKSSSFRLRLASASTFGLVKSRRGRVELTELGKAAVDPSSREAALVDAFLTVPLYERLYQTFQGGVLPDGPGLDRQIQTLGVTANTAAKARRAMLQSARTAGFFNTGSNRLVRPKVAQTPEPVSSGPVSSGPVSSTTASKQAHPYLQALWDILPDPDEPDEPDLWFELFERTFKKVYKLPARPNGGS